MAYHTIKIDWLPDRQSEWQPFTAARLEAGRLWSWLVERHADIRRQSELWPSKADLFKEIKRQFPNLHSQSAQQTVADFCEAVTSASALRKQGAPVEYPHKLMRYRQVIFTNQGARVRGNNLLLPCGAAGTLKVRIPETVTLPGRLMEVRLDYGRVAIVCQVPDEVRSGGPTIGVDLGVNTLIAATDGEKAILVNGREVKATVQLRNKKRAEIQAKQAHKTKGSRRHKRLQRAKYRRLDHAKNKVRDLCHKATRKVADTFLNAKAYVGKPFNDAARKMGSRQAQSVASACNRKIIEQLNYKLAAAIEVNEAYSSQTCPDCGKRSKHRRTYCCRCGFVAPRDVVGCANIRAIGSNGEMQPGTPVPGYVRFVHPSKYPGVNRVVPRTQGMLLGRVARESARRKP
jgi:putative transposase